VANIFTAFNFTVLLLDTATLAVPLPMCTTGFREVRGLSMGIESQPLHEGGNHVQPINLMGRVTYGSLVLRRGMSIDTGLWLWFERLQLPSQMGLRPSCVILVWNSTHTVVQYGIYLTGCLPVRLEAGELNAVSGLFAIEEIEIKYETMTLI
jgi:phage tail-like protein